MARPASEWRWVVYSTSSSSLRHQLLDQHLVDPGTGSTFEALERRGLVECRYERDPELLVPILFVKLTLKGRKLARQITGRQCEKQMPPGTLREWHWKALAVAYAAQPEGVKPDYAGAGSYSKIGWKTWLRLRDYKYQGKECPLIAEICVWVQVRREVFTGKRPPNAYEVRETMECEHRLQLTPFGQTYYEQHWQHYRQMYPEVVAPKPNQEGEASQ